MNYYNPNYGNYYIQDLQNIKNRIDGQIQQMQNYQPQQTPITQNFQLAPQSINELDGKYANSKDDVVNTLAIKPTLFINKDSTTLWIKDAIGNIKTYTLNEVVELDEKDIKINELQEQIKQLKGVIEYATNRNDISNVSESSSTEKSSSYANDKSSKK